jgi:hypothetical protein
MATPNTHLDKTIVPAGLVLAVLVLVALALSVGAGGTCY